MIVPTASDMPRERVDVRIARPFQTNMDEERSAAKSVGNFSPRVRQRRNPPRRQGSRRIGWLNSVHEERCNAIV